LVIFLSPFSIDRNHHNLAKTFVIFLAALQDSSLFCCENAPIGPFLTKDLIN
jgi:hypothetical protein